MIWLRRLTQLLSLAIVLGVPAFGIWAIRTETVYGAAEGTHRYSAIGAWTSEAVQGRLGDPNDWTIGWITGGTWSLNLFGLELTDPLAALSLATQVGLPPIPMLAGAVLVVVLNIALGRMFCGWFCPYGILSRLVSRVRPWLTRRGLTHAWRIHWSVRWIALVGVVAAPLVGMSLAPIVLPYLAVARASYGIWFGGVAGAGGVMLALLLSDVLLWDHGVCRSVCPSGLVQRLLGRYRVVHVVAKRGSPCQVGCHACAEVCWLGLDPRTGRVSDDCDSCGRCVSSCPTDRIALKVHVGRVLGPLLVLMMVSCGGGPAPEVISPTGSWTSPFQQFEGDAIVTVRQHVVRDHTVEIGTAELPDGTVCIRLYIVDPEGEAWRGPLSIEVGANQHVRLDFDAANVPRSTVRPSLYEATVRIPRSSQLAFASGPLEGTSVPVWQPRRGTAAAPVLLVVGAWLLGLVWRRAGPSQLV